VNATVRQGNPPDESLPPPVKTAAATLPDNKTDKTGVQYRLPVSFSWHKRLRKTKNTSLIHRVAVEINFAQAKEFHFVFSRKINSFVGNNGRLHDDKAA